MALNTTVSIVNYLKSKGQASDYTTRSKLYTSLNLESKYGSYLGSGQQNTGMLNLLQAQATQPVVQPVTQPTTTQPALQPIAEQIKTIQAQIPAIQAGVQSLVAPTAPTPLTLEEAKSILGRDLTADEISGIQRGVITKDFLLARKAQRIALGETYPTAGLPTTKPLTGGETRVNPQTGETETYSEVTSQWVSQTQAAKYPPPEELEPGTYEFGEKTTPAGTPAGTQIPETISKVNVTTPDVQMPTTDITSIINEITTGTLTTPEGVIAGEKRILLEETQKAAAAKALTTLQQNMAKRGMTFSGIRTEAEAQLAAESLAKMSGIALDTASDIIKAARQEQTRREQALTAVQTAQESALKAMGYVMNPYTGTIEKTLERERFEEPAAVKTFTSGGNIFQYDPDTGEMTMLYEAPEKEKNYQYFTDVDGNVTRYDPNTGETENLGPLAKGTGETLTERDRAIKVAAFAKARIVLEAEAKKTTDGYVYDTTYMRLRADYGELMGNTDDFDDMFAPMLSMVNRQKLGVGKLTL